MLWRFLPVFVPILAFCSSAGAQTVPPEPAPTAAPVSVALPIGIGTFLLTGPITHGQHHQWGRMGLSIASRTVLPFAGLLLGASSCNSDGNCSPALVGGLVGVGMLAATIVDVAVLPYEPVAETPAVQPLVSLSRDRLWLGAGGTF